MSTITKQWLQQKISDMEAARDEIPFGLDEDDSNTLAALRIALASFEAEKGAEPVAFINGAWTLVYYRPPKELGLKIGDKLYTAPPAQMLEIENLEHFISFWKKVQAGQMKPGKNDIDHTVWFLEGLSNLTTPPAPVSVPDFTVLDRLAGEMLTHAMNCERRVSVAYTHCAHRLAEEVRDYRAAMLQSFGNSEQLNSPVIPDGWVLVPEEPTHEMLEAGDEQFGTYDVYRRMIAASPQQEVMP